MPLIAPTIKKSATRIGLTLLLLTFNANATTDQPPPDTPQPSTPLTASISTQFKQLERGNILAAAAEQLERQPSTIVKYPASRSAGGVHDFYSEGDYWWPDPDNPDGPYIRRDGLSNPDNFIMHRLQLIKLSETIATLTSAYLLQPDARYLNKIDAHLNAWFISPNTKMTPSLQYAQAISGRNTGRSIGIIDTIHLTEVARSVYKLEQLAPGALNSAPGVKAWFAQYVQWLVTSDFGKTERQHPNNHGVCWAMQTAAFAQLTGNSALLNEIRQDFKRVFIQQMMAADGSFPAELARTKPYGYSLFVLDAMATTAQLLSNRDNNLWQYRSADGRGMAKAMHYMLPFVQDKSNWPFKPDVLYWHDWPVRQPAFIMAAQQFNNSQFFTAWKQQNAEPTEYEVLRNLPVRHPLLWLE
jgi:hypothetical protein